MSVYKTIPLSQKWQEELKKLTNTEYGSNKEYMNKMTALVAVLHTLDILYEKFEQKKLIIRTKHTLLFICSYFFAHCFHLGRSIYILAYDGYDIGITVLNRSILESVINLAYLWQCKNIKNAVNAREAWLKYDCVTSKQIYLGWEDMRKFRKNNNLPVPESFFDKERLEKIKTNYEAFKTKFGREKWTNQNLQSRAQEVDKLHPFKEFNIYLEELYILIYRYYSQSVHGEASSPRSYIEDTGTEFRVRFGCDYLGCIDKIYVTNILIIALIDMVNMIYHLNVDIIAQLKASGYKF
jgi:hypothetical protein